MKKKIITILIIMALGVTTLGVFAGCNNPSEPLEFRWFLMTQAEFTQSQNENWTFEQYYEHSNLEREYAETVVFDAGNSYRYRPIIYLITLNITNETKIYSIVPYRETRIVGENVVIGLDQNGFLFPRDFDNELIDEVISLQVIDEAGSVFGAAGVIGIRVIRNP